MSETPEQNNADSGKSLSNGGLERTAERLARYILNDLNTWRKKPDMPDYACSECVPGALGVIEGFRCGFHEAKAFLKILPGYENADL